MSLRGWYATDRLTIDFVELYTSSCPTCPSSNTPSLFAVDLAFAGLTMASVVVLRLLSQELGLISTAALVFIRTLLLGPGTATMLPWAWVELSDNP